MYEILDELTHFKTAPMHIPSGNVVGRSFNEWTTKSTNPCSKAISNSLVNRLFSPIFVNGLSNTMSPIVDIVTEIRYNYEWLMNNILLKVVWGLI